MRRSSKIVLITLAVLIAALVGGYLYERPLLVTGTGYAAHNACAVRLLAHRADPSQDLPGNPIRPLLKSHVSGASASGSILGALGKQRAWYDAGFGCTLAEKRPHLGTPISVSAKANPYADAQTPAAPTGAVNKALDRAFGTDLASKDRTDLGTRAVLVVKGGRLVAERYAGGFDADTPQLGWSMAKSVTSLIVGRLVAEGKVTLDDDHLRPEWTDDRAKITVRELLQMTSGLSWDETYALNTPITRMLYLERDMGRYVASRPLAHRPGTYQQYSSGSINLLCSILAKRTGEGANLPRQELFAPLGLASAVLEPDAVGTPVCSSYLWATPRDWAAIGQFALQNGIWSNKQLIPINWMANTTKAVDVKTEEDGYATGWWTNRRPDGTLVYPSLPADAYFAEGHDGQWLVIVPSQRLVVVRLGFTPTRDSDRTIGLAADLVKALG
ncbi:CubicO group peptidase (beta-lactamase class C family) [Marmoricola sp. URHA0025 HA25]